jgi:hypothetical protein
MLEIYKISMVNRLILLESKKFKSIYSDNEDFTPYKVELVKEVPEYNYKIMREFIKDFDMEVAYTLDNNYYIGNPKDAEYLCKKRGLHVELATPKSKVCSIGKCIYLPDSHDDFNKYFGWSHRAIFGFGVNDGYVVKRGDCLEGYFPLGYKAKTLEDCREMAVKFAESVS